MERARIATNESDDLLVVEMGCVVGGKPPTSHRTRWRWWYAARWVERRGKPTNESYDSLVVEMGCEVGGEKPPTSHQRLVGGGDGWPVVVRGRWVESPPTSHRTCWWWWYAPRWVERVRTATNESDNSLVVEIGGQVGGKGENSHQRVR